MAKEIFLATCLILVVSSFVESVKRTSCLGRSQSCYTTGCCQKRGCCTHYYRTTVLTCQVSDISGVESRRWYKDGNGKWQYYKFVEKCEIDVKATKEAIEALKEKIEKEREELAARLQAARKAMKAEREAIKKGKAAKKAKEAARAEELAKTSTKKPTKFASQGQ